MNNVKSQVATVQRTDHGLYALVAFRPASPSVQYSDFNAFIEGYTRGACHNMQGSTLYCKLGQNGTNLLIIPEGNEDCLPDGFLAGYVPYE